MTKSPLQRLAPFSLRLTKAERASLEKQAAGMPLGRFIRAQLFDDGQSQRREIAQILALLGKQERASSLRTIAKTACIGALPLTPEVEAQLTQACRDIAEIKSLLMKALRIKEH